MESDLARRCEIVFSGVGGTVIGFDPVEKEDCVLETPLSGISSFWSVGVGGVMVVTGASSTRFRGIPNEMIERRPAYWY